MSFTSTPTTTAGVTTATWTFSPFKQQGAITNPTTIPTTAALPLFGQPPTTAAPLFGQPPTTAAPLFGQPPTTAAPLFRPPTTIAAPFFGPFPTTTANPFNFMGSGLNRMPAPAPAPAPAPIPNPFNFMGSGLNRIPAPAPAPAPAPIPNPFAGSAPEVQSPFGPTFRTIPTTSAAISVNQTMQITTNNVPVMTNPLFRPQFTQPASTAPGQTFIPTTTNNPPFNQFNIQTRPTSTLPNLFIFPGTTNSTNTTAPTTTSIFNVPWTTLPTTTSASMNIPMAPMTSTVNATTSSNTIFQIPPRTNTTTLLNNPVLPPTCTAGISAVEHSQTTVSVPISNTTTQTTSNLVQQRILEAYLLDPYCRQGTKEWATSDNNQPPKDVSPPPPTTINVVTTSTATVKTTPFVLPLQSNTRKTSFNPIVDLKLDLKPVSTTMESNVEPTSTTASGKSSISSAFTQQEESILLNQNKTSRLRLSNDFLDSSSCNKPGLSLYPIRRLEEIEVLTEKIQITDISIPTASSTVVKSETKDSMPPKVKKPMPVDVQSAQLPILTRDGYYIEPTMAELKSLCNKQGECHVHQVTIGHEKYGSITFYGWINLSGMNLDEIVTIRHHEVIVYPDEDNKPPVGQGLNRSARITLFGTYPIDRTTHKEITDVDRIKAINYEEYLNELTKKFDGEFVSYDAIDGAWVFMVKHFSRYGLDMEIRDDSSHSKNH